MNTKTLKFDFSFLRDKKKSTMDELKGIRKNHPAEYTEYAIDLYCHYEHIPSPRLNTYFDIIRASLKITVLLDSSYIMVIDKDPIYEITYSTHNESKEYFMGCYVGKETGNIYFSNAGDDIVFSNIKEFSSDLDVKSVIKAIQTYKVTRNIDRLNEMVLEFTSVKNNSDSPYLSIFSISNTVNSFTNSVGGYSKLFDYFRYFLDNTKNYRPFLHSFRLVTLMVSHGVGRISKISEDMEELLQDLNKTIIPSTPSHFYMAISDDIPKIEHINDYVSYISSEYIAPDAHYSINTIKNNKQWIEELLLKSVIDNSIDDEATMYSDSFMDKVANALSVQSHDLKKKVRTLRGNISLGSIYTFGKTNHSNLKLSSSATIQNIMFMFDKIGYKYIQRLHSILGRI